MASRILRGFPWSACVRITWEVFGAKARAPPRTCGFRAGGRGLGTYFSNGPPGGPSGALGSGKRGWRTSPAFPWRGAGCLAFGNAAAQHSGSAPRLLCGGSRSAPREGQPRSPTPRVQISTCFQNLTTFLLRRTPFWSVILKAIKLQSPLCTSAPTANNLFLLLGIRFSCYGI